MIGTLRRERNFSILMAGNLLSQMGDGVHEFIFIITVLNVTKSDVALAGTVYFFRFIPYLVFGPLGGALSDRLSRRSLMLFADFVRMAITSVFCMLLATNHVDVFSRSLIGMFMTSFRTMFQPALQGTIPSIVQAENLPTANGAAQMTMEIGNLVGPALGGSMLAALGNSGYVLAIDAATYLMSILCIFRAIASRTSTDKNLKHEAISLRGLYGDFGQNLKTSLGKPELFVTISYSALCILFVGAALRILIPAMLKGSGYADVIVGCAMSFIALGALVGAIMCGKLMLNFNTRNLMLYWSLYGIALAILPACVFSVLLVLLWCFALGGLGAFVDVILPTNIQRLSTDANLGKNFSLFSTLANTGEALSGGLAAALAVVASAGTSLTIIGVLIASIAYIGKIKTVSRHA